LLDIKRPHSALYASLILPDLNGSLNTVWKEWIKLETQRRIAWMLYLFDTLSVIETGSIPVLSPKDMAFMPLPAPDCIWQTATAEAWQQALMAYSPITLDAAMREHFTSQSTGYATPGFVTPSSMSSILLRSDFGMFGRLVMAISLLRGLLLLAGSNSEAIDIAEHWGFVPSRFASGKLMVALVKAYGNALYKVSSNLHGFRRSSVADYYATVSGVKAGTLTPCVSHPLRLLPSLLLDPIKAQHPHSLIPAQTARGNSWIHLALRAYRPRPTKAQRSQLQVD
jgi:hypothetical protein